MQTAFHWLNDPLFTYTESPTVMPSQLTRSAKHAAIPSPRSGTDSHGASPTATIKSEDDLTSSQGTSSSRSSMYDDDREVEEGVHTQTTKPTPKRKRANRYKNASPAVLSRRRAQNRQSQRAYRARKDQLIHDLERKLTESKEQTVQLAKAYAELHAQYMGLKAARTGSFATDYLWAPLTTAL